MGDWPLYPVCARNVSMGAGVAINSHGSIAHTKGSYSELLASTTFAGSLLVIQFDYSAAYHDYLYDIAIGAAGVEQVIIANLVKGTTGSNLYCSAPFIAPVQIPSGSRISARVQCEAAIAQTTYLFGTMYDQSFAKLPLGVCDTYGADTSDSGGVEIDCGGTAWSWGSWVEITASTLRDHHAIIVGYGNKDNAARASTGFQVEIGVGANPNETAILLTFMASDASAFALNPLFSPLLPVNIPKGTRLSVRAQCGLTDATDRLFDAVLYCFS